MRTLDNYLEFHLTSKEVEIFLENGIINGCGGDGGFNFSSFIEDNLKYLSYFDTEKVVELRNDITRICYEHDLSFWLQLGFTKSNYKMARKIYGILYWVKPLQRLAICFVLFILLQRHGKIYYDKCYRGNK